MFSTLQYSYAAGDEYDTREFKKNNFIYVFFNYSSPTITAANESTT